MTTYTIKLKDLSDDREYITTLETGIFTEKLGYQLSNLQEQYAKELDTHPYNIQIVSIELIDEQSISYKKAIDNMCNDLIVYIRDEEKTSKGYIKKQLQKIKALNK